MFKKQLYKKHTKFQLGLIQLTSIFLGSNKQFDWLEISIVFDKSEKHTTICDSYNVELAVNYMQLVKLSSFTKVYSLTNEKKYEVSNVTQKPID